MRILPREISVVVQGAVNKCETARCLKSLRIYLPEAQVILSTWKGSDTQGLDYDECVLSEDPGSIGFHYYKDKVVPYNFNRQLVSTVAGLAAAERKYALKMRTDFYLKGNKFLCYFDFYPARNAEFNYFRHRVIVPSVFSRRFSDGTGFPLPFHPSDFFFFGLKEDVRDYFSHCEFLSKAEGCEWQYKFSHRKPYLSETGRYTPEQHLCLAWLEWHGMKPDYEDFSDWSEDVLCLSDKILFNNFIFLNPAAIGVSSGKHHNALLRADLCPWYGLITQDVFEQEYKRYFDVAFKLARRNDSKLLYYAKKLYCKLRMH